ncbi:MAG: polysaccharide deacetylase family protein [Luteolibacter sp.]
MIICFLVLLLPLKVVATLPVPPDDPGIEDDGVRVSVLGYHDFSETLPETEMRINTTKFRKQLEIIQQLGITVISLDDFAAWKRGDMPLPEKCVLLTFDDGWRSVYNDAFPILKEFGHPFVLYLYKNYVDGGGKALTTPMIREMMANGATLGSHSVSHPLPSMVRRKRDEGPEAFDEYLRVELGKSKEFLESRFRVPVTTYAYPGGFFTEEMLMLAPEIGYTHLFTVQPAKVRRASPNDALPRYMILGTHDRIFEFATMFRDASDAVIAPEGAIVGMLETTPHPVRPEAGAIVNSRTPEITADLSAVGNLDPTTLAMKIAGFGQVPAKYDSESGQFSWMPNRRLRHPICRVEVTWRDTDGKSPEKPLAWSFQIDRESVYLGEGE